MHVFAALSICEHACSLYCILRQYVYDALCACFLLMHSYLFHMRVFVLGEEARIQVPQSVRQHLVRQASVMAPQGKAAYCGHEPWWLSLLGGLHMRTDIHTCALTHRPTHRSTYTHVCRYTYITRRLHTVRHTHTHMHRQSWEQCIVGWGLK